MIQSKTITVVNIACNKCNTKGPDATNNNEALARAREQGFIEVRIKGFSHASHFCPDCIASPSGMAQKLVDMIAAKYNPHPIFDQVVATELTEWTEHNNDIDREIAEESKCPKCEKPMHYKGYKIQEQDNYKIRYRAFSVCTQCTYYEEF